MVKDDKTIFFIKFNKRDAKKEKSYGTATNVGAILFWLTGVVATQMMLLELLMKELIICLE